MIELKNVGKKYRDGWKKPLWAAQNVSFVCNPGEVACLVGPNGAGKTTTLRVIATALKPTTGDAIVEGINTKENPNDVRRILGFLSANTGLYGRLTPRETLHFFARLYDMDATHTKNRIEILVEEFQLSEFLDRPCDKLSTGMSQRVNLARTLLHDPKVVVLDEPTAGLDILSSRAVIDFIKRLRTEGKTVLFSSHVMSEIDKLCDRLIVIHKGLTFFDGPISDFRALHGDDLEEAFLKAVGEQP